MALGKPVIATGYSGNLHFMKPETSYLVDYSRGPCPPGCEPYPVTAAWADPDLDQAAAFMREVYERPEAARREAPPRGPTSCNITASRRRRRRWRRAFTDSRRPQARLSPCRELKGRSILVSPSASARSVTIVGDRAARAPASQLDRLANLTVDAGGSAFPGFVRRRSDCFSAAPALRLSAAAAAAAVDRGAAARRGGDSRGAEDARDAGCARSGAHARAAGVEAGAAAAAGRISPGQRRGTAGRVLRPASATRSESSYGRRRAKQRSVSWRPARCSRRASVMPPPRTSSSIPRARHDVGACV